MAMRGCKERKPQICGGEYSMFIVFYFYYNHVHVYSSTTSHQRTLNSGMKVQNNVVYKCHIVNITFILFTIVNNNCSVPNLPHAVHCLKGR